MIKEILIWLAIFIFGSLIVSYILNPSSLDGLKDNLNEFSNSLHLSKVGIEISSGMWCLDSGWNREICQITCSQNSLNYKINKCINGEIICNCG